MEAETMKRICALFAAVLALPVVYGNAPPAADVAITVSGISQPTGAIYLSLCREPEFMTPNCYRTVGRAIANRGNQVMTIRAVPSGTYAILAFHDVNDNRQLDRNGYGAPTEPTGTSGRQTGANQMPQFSRSSFVVNGRRVNLSIGLR
jgi:uncharacterized protein (DUF2141 family)